MKSDVKNESILTLSWLFYYFIKIRKYHILLFIYQPVWLSFRFRNAKRENASKSALSKYRRDDK